MLNFIALRGSGGEGFGWLPTLSATVRDQILAWERSHDTLAGGRGSDPHGWRNALNYYGWGEAALWAGARSMTMPRTGRTRAPCAPRSGP